MDICESCGNPYDGECIWCEAMPNNLPIIRPHITSDRSSSDNPYQEYSGLHRVIRPDSWALETRYKAGFGVCGLRGRGEEGCRTNRYITPHGHKAPPPHSCACGARIIGTGSKRCDKCRERHDFARRSLNEARREAVRQEAMMKAPKVSQVPKTSYGLPVRCKKCNETVDYAVVSSRGYCPSCVASHNPGWALGELLSQEKAYQNKRAKGAHWHKSETAKLLCERCNPFGYKVFLHIVKNNGLTLEAMEMFEKEKRHQDVAVECPPVS